MYIVVGAWCSTLPLHALSAVLQFRLLCRLLLLLTSKGVLNTVSWYMYTLA